MKRSDLIELITNLLFKNITGHDADIDENLPEKLINLFEENNLITPLERNTELVICDIEYSLDFWRSFVEGQSKAIHFYSKKNREYRKLLRENGLLDEKE